MAIFRSGRWNTGTYPDLTFVSVDPDRRVPDRRILEKFPRSQHQAQVTSTMTGNHIYCFIEEALRGGRHAHKSPILKPLIVPMLSWSAKAVFGYFFQPDGKLKTIPQCSLRMFYTCRLVCHKLLWQTGLWLVYTLADWFVIN